MPTEQKPYGYALCICGHKRSEHSLWSLHCPKQNGDFEPDSLFTLDPDATAHGHNPDQLSQAEVGTAQEWRLLEEDEIIEWSHEARKVPVELWCGARVTWDGDFGEGWTTHVPQNTYRTRLTRAELRAARGLEPEVVAHVSRKPDLVCALCGGTKAQCIERRCWGVYNENMVPRPSTLADGAEGSTQSLAASAVAAQAERTDDLTVKHNVPALSVNTLAKFTTKCSVCGKHYESGVGSTECCGGMNVVVNEHEELWSHMMKLNDALCSARHYREQRDKLIRVYGAHEVYGDATPDSGGKLDLEVLAREGAEQVKRHFGVEDLGALTQIFREPLQKADAAARQSTDTRIASTHSTPIILPGPSKTLSTACERLESSLATSTGESSSKPNKSKSRTSRKSELTSK